MFEERILDSRVDFSLRELLGIAKKEFHDLLADLLKSKRQTTEENAPRVNANIVLMNDTELKDEVPNSHYTGPQRHVQLWRLRSESETSKSPY